MAGFHTDWWQFFTQNMTILQYFYAALVSAEQNTFNAQVPLVQIPVNRMNLLSKYAGDIRQTGTTMKTKCFTYHTAKYNFKYE